MKADEAPVSGQVAVDEPKIVGLALGRAKCRGACRENQEFELFMALRQHCITSALSG